MMPLELSIVLSGKVREKNEKNQKVQGSILIPPRTYKVIR
jgi:hypothetical protein